jgi:peptidyl-prolyl cis-trans isomerase C
MFIQSIFKSRAARVWLLTLALPVGAWAQQRDAASSTAANAANTPAGVVASPAVMTVNGTKISVDMLEQLVAAAVVNGAKDGAELREAIKTELVARTVLAQEARKLSLDKPVAAQNQLAMARDGVLAELAVQKFAEKVSLSEDVLQAEYKRQLTLLADVDQYLVSNMVVQTEAEAVDIIKKLKSGASFETLAKEKSLDNSRTNGGSLGWLLANQLVQPLPSVIVNLAKGAVAAAPIATQVGWQVIKLDDKRKFVPPSFEESRQQLVRAVQTNQRNDYVQKLVKAAKVEGAGK